MKINFTLFSISILFLVSCQKEISFDTSGGSTPPSSSGTCNTYFPLTVGSTWTYDFGAGVTQTNTVSSPDTVIAGQTFKRVNQLSSGTTSTTFFREDNNGNVFGYVDLGMAGASGQIFINPIRSNAAVGDIWRDTISVNGFTERFEYQMMEKNINYQVDTFHFTNVQHVQYKVRLDLPPVYSDELVQITDFWYAKCIGGVETKNQSILMGATVNTTDEKIKSYTIH